MDKSALNKTEKLVKKEATGIVWLGIKLAFARIFLSQKRYNRYLNKMIKGMSDISFPLYAQMLTDCIKLTKKRSSQYQNLRLESEAVIQQFSRLKPYYKEVVSLIKAHRQKYGLQI